MANALDAASLLDPTTNTGKSVGVKVRGRAAPITGSRKVFELEATVEEGTMEEAVDLVCEIGAGEDGAVLGLALDDDEWS